MKTSVYPSACGDIPGTLLRIAEAQELLMISKSCKSLGQCEDSGIPAGARIMSNLRAATHPSYAGAEPGTMPAPKIVNHNLDHGCCARMKLFLRWPRRKEKGRSHG